MSNVRLSLVSNLAPICEYRPKNPDNRITFSRKSPLIKTQYTFLLIRHSNKQSLSKRAFNVLSGFKFLLVQFQIFPDLSFCQDLYHVYMAVNLYIDTCCILHYVADSYLSS